MRDIKFRGKTILNGMWIEGCYQRLVIDGVMRHFILSDDFLFFDDIKLIAALTEVHPETVGQFTGIKDKNDIEIYEGYIVKIHEGMHDFKITAIIWNEQYALYIPTNKNLRYEINSYYSKHYKLIGNIHDNPELIKQN